MSRNCIAAWSMPAIKPASVGNSRSLTTAARIKPSRCFSNGLLAIRGFKSSNFRATSAIKPPSAPDCIRFNADAVILLDGDLQDPPELIPELANAWKNGASVVLARGARGRKRGFAGSASKRFMHSTNTWFNMHVPPHTGTFSLLDRDALTALNNLPEAHRFFPGLRSWVGFSQAMVEYDTRRSLQRAAKTIASTIVCLRG